MVILYVMHDRHGLLATGRSKFRGFVFWVCFICIFVVVHLPLCWRELFACVVLSCSMSLPLQNLATSGTANRRPRSSRRAVPSASKSRARSSSPKAGPWVPAPGKATRGSRITWQVLEGGCHGNLRLHSTKKRGARSGRGSKVGYDFMSPSSSPLPASSCQLLLTFLVLSPWFLVHVECWDRGEDVGVSRSTHHTVDTGHHGADEVA